MYKIKRLKTKNQIIFELPLEKCIDNITLIYNDGSDWDAKLFMRTQTKFKCTINVDKSVDGFEFVYLYDYGDTESYINDEDAELIDNPFGTKNSFIRL